MTLIGILFCVAFIWALTRYARAVKENKKHHDHSTLKRAARNIRRNNYDD